MRIPKLWSDFKTPSMDEKKARDILLAYIRHSRQKEIAGDKEFLKKKAIFKNKIKKLKTIKQYA